MKSTAYQSIAVSLLIILCIAEIAVAAELLNVTSDPKGFLRCRQL